MLQLQHMKARLFLSIVKTRGLFQSFLFLGGRRLPFPLIPSYWLPF